MIDSDAAIEFLNERRAKLLEELKAVDQMIRIISIGQQKGWIDK